MTIIKQAGPDGANYDTKDFPFILMSDPHLPTRKVEGRVSDINKAHLIRLHTQLAHPNKTIMLMNEKTKEFIDWRPEDRGILYGCEGNESHCMKKVGECMNKKGEELKKCMSEIGK